MRTVLLSILIGALAGSILVACCNCGDVPKDVPSGSDPGAEATIPDVAPGDGQTGGEVLPDVTMDQAAEVVDDVGPDIAPDAPVDSGTDVADLEAHDAGSETDSSQPPVEAHPLYDFAGHVLLTELFDAAGKLLSSGINVRFESGPVPPYSTLMHEEGACQFLIAAAEPKCQPECEKYLEYCGPDKQCHEIPHRVSAGDVTITGTKEMHVAKPGDSDWYVVTPDPAGDLFEQGKSINVKASGDDIPAFEVELEGTGTMKVPWSEPLVLKNGSDFVVAWEPQGDGAIVELAIMTGWHGSPPAATIWCTGIDADGQIVIPQKMVEGYPPAGGIGLFQWMSFIRRVQRKALESPFGPIEVTVSSDYWFTIEH